MSKQKKPTRPVRPQAPSPAGQPKTTPAGSPSGLRAFFQNTRLQSILIFSFAFLLYANTLGHQWAQDDTVVITDNMLTQQGLKGIPDIFAKDTFFGYFKIEGKASVVSGGRYRPLTVALFAVVYQLFGKNPMPFHLLTVSLFALACLLLYRTLLLLLRDYKGAGYAEVAAWMAALLFAAHPVHTEAVANIKGCDEIATLLGSLGALYLSLKAVDTGKTIYGLAASAALLLGLLAKENAVTFLAVIPLALLFFRGSGVGQLVKTGWPLLAAFGVFFVMRMAVLPELFSKPPVELLNNPYLKWVDGHWVDFSSEEKYATIFYTLGRYVGLLFVPLTLTHDYYPRHIGIMHWADAGVLASILLYAGLAGYALWGWWQGRRDLLRFGILFYLITLSIVSNLVFPIGTNMGERFLFMPSIGFCLAATALLLGFAGYDRETGFQHLGRSLAVFAVIAVLFSIKTVLRNPVWYDNRTLAFTDVATSVNSTKVQSFCGSLRCEDGINEKDPARKTQLLQEAVQYNSRAIAIHPTHKSALLNRGVAYFHLKQYDEAISDLRQVLALVPDDPKGHLNLSQALCGKGKTFEEGKQDFNTALQFLKEAIEVDSTNQEAVWHLGTVQAKRGDLPDAIRWFTKFTEIRPNDPAAWGGLEWAYGLAGDRVKAAECHAKVAELTPKPAGAQ